jgi:hypothetical protein
MTTHITKTWFDGEKLVTQEIAESEVYKQEPVAEVKLKTTGGNVGIATVIHEIYSHYREPLRVGDKLYTTPPAAQQEPVAWDVFELRLYGAPQEKQHRVLWVDRYTHPDGSTPDLDGLLEAATKDGGIDGGAKTLYVRPLYTTPPAAQESGPVSIKKVAEGHGMNLPTEFVPKRDESKAAIRSLTDQCAALIQERDELQKRVWQYEKLTPPAAQREPAPGYCKHCKQYTIEEPLPAVQREWVGLTDEEAMQTWGLVVKYAPSEVRLKSFARLIRDKLKEKNNGRHG